MPKIFVIVVTVFVDIQRTRNSIFVKSVKCLLVVFSITARSWFSEDMDRLQDKENTPDTSENAQQKTANIVSNMAIAHELLMDDSFRLQSELPQNS